MIAWGWRVRELEGTITNRHKVIFEGDGYVILMAKWFLDGFMGVHIC